MTLHENEQLFRQSVEFTAQQMGIPAIYVEKDYWVTYALHILYHSELKSKLVFKGGTALSKCFQLIDRFSEDVDLVVLRNEEESGNELKKTITKVSKLLHKTLPEVPVENVTKKMGMNRKTAHSYNKSFQGKYGQIRDVIIVEATWFGHYEPYIKKKVNSFIYDMLKENNPEAAIKYNLLPFEVLVLEPSRTLCEKIMSLVRFSYGENPIENLGMKIRHTYDLYFLLNNKEIKLFFESQQFEKMLFSVAADDVVSFKNNHKWLKYHPVDALIFKDTETVWKKLKPIYNDDFKNLVYGHFPDENEILKTLQVIQKRIEKMPWNLKV
ncbi:MAG: nucleotidyl transferase AbiEii/AbiGii toxin family protein [Flavobacteriaceae bacterium]